MKAVIFDRDGVIIDSEKLQIDSMEKSLGEIGVKLTEEEKRSAVGKHPKIYYPLFQRKYSFSVEKLLARHLEIYDQNLDRTPLFKEAILLIKELHRQKIPLALNASGERKRTLKVLQMAGLETQFSVVVTGDEVKNLKPDPESYLLAARRLGFEPRDCVAVEDSAVGLSAAKAAGMKCIIIYNSTTRTQDFSGADLVVDSAGKLSIGLLQKF
jgi:beta-phosphoglucomutase